MYVPPFKVFIKLACHPQGVSDSHISLYNKKRVFCLVQWASLSDCTKEQNYSGIAFSLENSISWLEAGHCDLRVIVSP